MDDNPKQDREDPPAPPGASGGAKPAAPGETVFDLWLNRSLHQLYDGVAAEPIPAELLKLIESDRDRRRG